MYTKTFRMFADGFYRTLIQHLYFKNQNLKDVSSTSIRVDQNQEPTTLEQNMEHYLCVQKPQKCVKDNFSAETFG